MTQQITLNVTKRTVIVTRDSPGNYRVAFHHPEHKPTLMYFEVFQDYTKMSHSIINWLAIGSLPSSGLVATEEGL